MTCFDRVFPHGRALGQALILAVLLLATGCQAILPTPPREATREALAAGTAEPLPTPRLVAAPTPTGEPIPTPAAPAAGVNPNPVVTLWVNETSEAHRAVLEEMQAELDANHGIFLEYVMIDAGRLPRLVETAALSGTLPDLILHPVEYTMGWTASGILDPAAAQTAFEQLGRETFDEAALDLVSLEDGQPAALPNHGAPQLLIYRQDWFDILELEPPADFDAMLAAAAAIYRSEVLSARTGLTTTLISGLVVPTESDLIRTQQVFEQLALANGCELIDERGEVTILSPACGEALAFYREIVNLYSPSDIQTNISALNAYLAGRTGMIFTSPSTLVALAGLDERYRPVCPECAADPAFLSGQTGLITTITGRGAAARPVDYSTLTYLGITGQADAETVRTFLDYWYGAGYLSWIGVEPERKVPMRLGSREQPGSYREAWFDLPVRPGEPALEAILGRETLEPLVASASGGRRWGFGVGRGPLMSEIYEGLLFSILQQEMLSGYFTSGQAVIEAYQRVVDLIPDYPFPIDPLPTPVEEMPAPEGG